MLIMESVRFGGWQLSCDPESTRKAYAAVQTGGPEECGCKPCLNFIAARYQIYDPDVLALLGRLGISPNREVEIYHMARLESGRHLYGGWFHFVGSIVSGDDAAEKVSENIWRPNLEENGEYFSLGFSSKRELVREPFAGLPLVQLEFIAKVPWVLPTGEPDR
jgi:hypothetical protein